MSMSDLELLELVEKAKQKQRGPQGPAGVGIESIEQHEDNSFTIKLTTGEHKKITLPAAKDGAVGPQGVQGERGEPGSAGRPGRDGAPGADALPGVPGRDGDHVDTGVVNSQGELLLGLTSGKVINVGKVVGPAGQTGQRGPTGLPGEAGKDGTAVLGGARSPNADDGKPGDFWIDISTAEFAFFRKADDSNWTKLANLRQPARDTRVSTAVGGGPGGGGSGGELQNTRTLPLVNGGTTFRKQAETRGLPPIPGEMATQEDANLYFLEAIQNGDVIVSDTVPRPPHQVGQLWFSTNPDELTLYIYDGAVWVPAAPPVSLDGIESSITNIEGDLIELHNNVRDVKGDVVLTNQDLQALVQDQERQDLQIVELEEEIEALAPTFDRGKWTFVEGDSIGPGEYGMGLGVDSTYCQEKYLECLAEAGDDEVAKTACNRQMGDCEAASTEGDGEFYMNDWAHAAFLHFHKLDADGTEHTFGDCEVGQYIDLFDQKDDNYALFEVTEAPIQEGDVYKIGVTPIQHQGEAEGLARVKIFELAGTDPTEYVRKSGDTMTGPLVVAPNRGSSPSVELKPAPDSPGTRAVIYTRDKDNQISFLVAADGSPRAGKSESSPFFAKVDWDLTTKKYVDHYLNTKIGRDFIWTLGNAGPWELRQKDSSDQEQKFIEIFDGKMNLRNVDTPASEGDAATKGYVDHAVANVTAGMYGSPYVYRGEDKKAENLQPGEFFISSNQSLYAHPKDALGRDSLFTEANFFPNRAFKGILKVYYSNGDLKHAFEFSEIIAGNSSNKYVKWAWNHAFKNASGWTSGNTYYLADGFILPF